MDLLQAWCSQSRHDVWIQCRWVVPMCWPFPTLREKPQLPICNGSYHGFDHILLATWYVASYQAVAGCMMLHVTGCGAWLVALTWNSYKWRQYTYTTELFFTGSFVSVELVNWPLDSALTISHFAFRLSSLKSQISNYNPPLNSLTNHFPNIFPRSSPRFRAKKPKLATAVATLPTASTVCF